MIKSMKPSEHCNSIYAGSEWSILLKALQTVITY
jgi:hypothetical protein